MPECFANISTLLVKLAGIWHWMKAKLDQMPTARKGAIVNHSSRSGLVGVAGITERNHRRCRYILSNMTIF